MKDRGKMSFDELIVKIEEQYWDDNNRYAYHFCEGMIFALVVAGHITSEQEENAKNFNDKCYDKYAYDNMEE